MPNVTRVFVSYAWRDGAAVAEWLYRRLNALDGWSAWMDLELHADTLFSHELQRRLDDADLVVVVVSPDVNRRDTPSFVLKELQYATDPQVNKPVFAVRAAACPLPLVIQGWTYTDFLDAAQYETAFAALLAKITSGRQPPRPQTPREFELAYLQQIGQKYDHWRDLYTDMAATARFGISQWVHKGSKWVICEVRRSLPKTAVFAKGLQQDYAPAKVATLEQRTNRGPDYPFSG